jgi:hypothetical protein
MNYYGRWSPFRKKIEVKMTSSAEIYVIVENPEFDPIGVDLLLFSKSRCPSTLAIFQPWLYSRTSFNCEAMSLKLSTHQARERLCINY